MNYGDDLVRNKVNYNRIYAWKILIGRKAVGEEKVDQNPNELYP